MGSVRRLMQDHDQPWRLYDPGQAAEIEEWDAHGQAARERTVLPEVLHPLLTYSPGPRSQPARRQVLGDIVIVAILSGRAGPASQPNAGQVRLTISGARRWSG